MPAEGGKHHTHVDPRCSGAAYILPFFVCNFKNRKRRLVKIIKVK